MQSILKSEVWVWNRWAYFEITRTISSTLFE